MLPLWPGDEQSCGAWTVLALTLALALALVVMVALCGLMRATCPVPPT